MIEDVCIRGISFYRMLLTEGRIFGLCLDAAKVDFTAASYFSSGSGHDSCALHGGTGQDNRCGLHSGGCL